MSFGTGAFKLPTPPNRPGSSGEGIPNSTLADLQSQVARQNLMIQTLCRILLAKGVVEEKELQEWMSYVDKLDGVEDGRLRESKAPRECPSCRRMNAPKAVKCQYCGVEFPPIFLEPEKPSKA